MTHQETRFETPFVTPLFSSGHGEGLSSFQISFLVALYSNFSTVNAFEIISLQKTGDWESSDHMEAKPKLVGTILASYKAMNAQRKLLAMKPLSHMNSELSTLSTSTPWQNDYTAEHGDDHQLFFVTSYSDFGKLGKYSSMIFALSILRLFLVGLSARCCHQRNFAD
jgi:hypothetical protein